MPVSSSDKRLSLRCPSCAVRLRAPRELLGRTCPCPRCRTPISVREPIPSDSDVMISPLEIKRSGR
jgi:hypothetical protein